MSWDEPIISFEDFRRLQGLLADSNARQNVPSLEELLLNNHHLLQQMSELAQENKTGSQPQSVGIGMVLLHFLLAVISKLAWIIWTLPLIFCIVPYYHYVRFIMAAHLTPLQKTLAWLIVFVDHDQISYSTANRPTGVRWTPADAYQLWYLLAAPVLYKSAREVPASLRRVRDELAKIFSDSFDVEVSLSEHDVNCFKPSGPESNSDSHYLQLIEEAESKRLAYNTDNPEKNPELRMVKWTVPLHGWEKYYDSLKRKNPRDRKASRPVLSYSFVPRFKVACGECGEEVSTECWQFKTYRNSGTQTDPETKCDPNEQRKEPPPQAKAIKTCESGTKTDHKPRRISLQRSASGNLVGRNTKKEVLKRTSDLEDPRKISPKKARQEITTDQFLTRKPDSAPLASDLELPTSGIQPTLGDIGNHEQDDKQATLLCVTESMLAGPAGSLRQASSHDIVAPSDKLAKEYTNVVAVDTQEVHPIAVADPNLYQTDAEEVLHQVHPSETAAPDIQSTDSAKAADGNMASWGDTNDTVWPPDTMQPTAVMPAPDALEEAVPLIQCNPQQETNISMLHDPGYIHQGAMVYAAGVLPYFTESIDTYQDHSAFATVAPYASMACESHSVFEPLWIQQQASVFPWYTAGFSVPQPALAAEGIMPMLAYSEVQLTNTSMQDLGSAEHVLPYSFDLEPLPHVNAGLPGTFALPSIPTEDFHEGQHEIHIAQPNSSLAEDIEERVPALDGHVGIEQFEIHHDTASGHGEAVYMTSLEEQLEVLERAALIPLPEDEFGGELDDDLEFYEHEIPLIEVKAPSAEAKAVSIDVEGKSEDKVDENALQSDTMMQNVEPPIFNPDFTMDIDMAATGEIFEPAEVDWAGDIVMDQVYLTDAVQDIEMECVGQENESTDQPMYISEESMDEIMIEASHGNSPSPQDSNMMLCPQLAVTDINMGTSWSDPDASMVHYGPVDLVNMQAAFSALGEFDQLMIMNQSANLNFDEWLALTQCGPSEFPMTGQESTSLSMNELEQRSEELTLDGGSEDAASPISAFLTAALQQPQATIQPAEEEDSDAETVKLEADEKKGGVPDAIEEQAPDVIGAGRAEEACTTESQVPSSSAISLLGGGQGTIEDQRANPLGVEGAGNASLLPFGMALNFNFQEQQNADDLETERQILEEFDDDVFEPSESIQQQVSKIISLPPDAWDLPQWQNVQWESEAKDTQAQPPQEAECSSSARSVQAPSTPTALVGASVDETKSTSKESTKEVRPPSQRSTPQGVNLRELWDGPEPKDDKGKMDDAVTISGRPKLKPKSRKTPGKHMKGVAAEDATVQQPVGGESSTTKDISTNKRTMNASDIPGLHLYRSDATPETPQATGEEKVKEDTKNQRPDFGEAGSPEKKSVDEGPAVTNAAKEESIDEPRQTKDKGKTPVCTPRPAQDSGTAGSAKAREAQEAQPAPLIMGGLILPGGNPVQQGTPCKPSSEEIDMESQIAGPSKPRYAKTSAQRKEQKLKERVEKKKTQPANVFHDKGRKGLSTTYGTRCPGSAERDTELRSSNRLDMLNATQSPHTIPLPEKSELPASSPLSKGLQFIPISKAAGIMAKNWMATPEDEQNDESTHG